MPGDSGGPSVTTLVCSLPFCTRGCGCIGHPAFPTPSVGRKIPANLGRLAPRDCGAVSAVIMTQLENVLMQFAARDMSARDIAKGQCGPKRDSGAGIVAPHDARHIVTDGIEPFDRMAICVKGACVPVGPDAGAGAEIADHHLDRVKGSVLDRSDAGVR